MYIISLALDFIFGQNQNQNTERIDFVKRESEVGNGGWECGIWLYSEMNCSKVPSKFGVCFMYLNYCNGDV